MKRKPVRMTPAKVWAPVSPDGRIGAMFGCVVFVEPAVADGWLIPKGWRIARVIIREARPKRKAR